MRTDINNIKDEVRNQKDNAKADVREAASHLRAVVGNVQDKLLEFAHDAGAKVSDLVHNGRDKFYDARDQYIDRVREKHVQNNIMTLGAGVLLGLLLRRR